MSRNSEAPPAAVDDGGVSEIILLGVRVKVDPMRKSVSMNNLSEYEPANKDLDGPMENGIKVVPPKAAAEEGSGGGYASADDDAAPGPNGNLQRKRGVPWSEEEHGLFLIGLDRVGRGDWRGISRNFVKTRTPTQVASHAQKYFIRRNNFSRRRRRSSLFDMTTDAATAMQIEKVNSRTEESHAQPRTANSKGFSVGPASLSMQNGNTKEKSSQNNMIKTPSTMVDPNLNHNSCIEALPLSLRLSLSWAQDQPFTASSDHGMMPSLKNGDNYISVA